MNKKVLIVCGIPHFNFYNKHSAVAAYLMSIKNNLEKDGYEVVLSHKAVQAGGSNGSSGGGSSTLKKLLRSISKSLYQNLSDFLYLKKQAELLHELLQEDVPCQIIEFLTYGSVIGYELKKKFNVPLLLIYDSPIAEQYREMHGAHSMYLKTVEKREKLSVEAADDLICYSAPVEEYLRAKHRISGNVHILPTIIWEKMSGKNSSAPQSDSIDVGFFGSFLKWHKVDLLVKVFAEIADEFPKLRLHLVGYGAEWENIRDQISDLPCNNRIFLPGFIDEEELQNLKNEIDIGLMPGSNWYGSPLKIFEYAWLKIPVIAADTPTISDLFEDGKDILLIAPGNEYESLKEHFRKILLNREFGNMLGLNLYKTVEEKYAREKYYLVFSRIVEKACKNE